MKTTKLITASILLLLFMSITKGTWAQVGGLTQTGNMTVCLNATEPFGVMPTAGSTYSWSILPGTGGTGTITNGAAPNNLISVNWTSAGTCTLQVVETNSSGCDGPPVQILITVMPLNTIALTSAIGTDNQSLCTNTPLTDITYATTGATGATVTGLPAGVTGSWSANVVTISGTPTVSGTFNYTVTLTGGCGTITRTGTITVIQNNTLTLTSAIGTDNQSLCVNSAITTITYATTGATGATVTGLPSGVTGTWAGNVVTISGTPTVSGTFNYLVTLTGGCGTITANGSIDITPTNTIALSSASGTDNQSICINTALTNITYATSGANGATVTGLPTGVNGTWASNVVTISGTPSVSGIFNYTVTLTGGCGNITTNGTITVTPNNTIALSSAAGTDSQSICINTPLTAITYATTGATGATITGLPAGVSGNWSGNVVTISGTPTVSGSFTYTITLTGGCDVVTTTGVINVTSANTITLSSSVGSDNQAVCINSAITDITYASTGATGATVTGLPAGVNGSWSSNVVTISGTPSVSGTFNYTVTLTGGCGNVTANGTITVNPLPVAIPIWHN